VVNALLAGSGNTDWSKTTNHLLLWDIAQTTSWFGINNDPVGTTTVIRNLSLRGSVLPSGSFGYTDGGNVLVDSNHWLNSATSYGTNTTTGGSLNSLFANPAAGDYRAIRGSVIDARLSPGLVRGDLLGRPVLSPAALGPLQP
jgi:hypothetical protein